MVRSRAIMSAPLSGKRILVPPSRPEVNPLLVMLRIKGAEVFEFPAIRVLPPEDMAQVDDALRRLEGFDWLIFSGSNSTRNFLDRAGELGIGVEAVAGRKVAAIGHGALGLLRERGVRVDYYPKRHVAEDVVAGLPREEISSGKRFLLIRVEGGPRGLVEELERLGAKVSEVAGYRLVVEADRDEAERLFSGGFDLVAFANPTAVRVFVKGAEIIGRSPLELTGKAQVVSVGPATTGAVKLAGLPVSLSSGGGQADLVRDLISRFGRTS